MAGNARRTTTSAVVDGLLGTSRVLVAMSAQSVAQLDPDVTLVQFRSLVVLASRGPQRTADLAATLGIAPSTVTRMCDRLVRKGLVQRFRRVADRRATWVALTEPGQDLVGEVMRYRRKVIGRLVRAMQIKDPDAFAAMLGAFVEAAGEVPEPRWWQQWGAAATIPPDAVTA
jgi:DNA-binding MarR family transcriptional regulator